MSEEDTDVEEISEEEFKKAEDEAEKEFEESKEETKEEIEEESEKAEDVGGEKPEEKRVDSFNREMHDAVCADCGKKCEVPFKPAEGRPVYCRDCYRNHMPQRRRF